DKTLYNKIIDAEWNREVEITPFFTLEKIEGDYLTDNLPSFIDVIYFDAFAPEKQPEMWTREAFERLYASASIDAILTTYCSKGVIRRMLADIGFKVERIAGPKNGKREILRATKNK
ncbi:MAG: SAM-dependent methyltransferase, partial [Bacteroidales bacterium]|nr:SAM-dependent methyltransferase [Bacteroidales bacterium]